MYNISLFRLYKNKEPEKGLFREIEISNFTADFCDLLGNLCNDIVALKILEFFDEFEKCGAREDVSDNPFAEKLCDAVDLLHDHLYDKCMRLTLHRRIKESGLKSAIDKLDIHNALDVINTPEMKKQLEELLEGGADWIEVIDPRRKEDWENFFEVCSDLESISYTTYLAFQRTLPNINFNYTPKLSNWIKTNKELFYSPKDTPIDTGMGSILRKVKDLNKIVTGLNYQEQLDASVTIADKRYL